MPKKRNKAGTRKVNKKIIIVCEGAKDKSESAYFKELKRCCFFASNEIEVIIQDTETNTGKELVKIANSYRDKIYKDIDEAWVVYDKDGYSKHAETFDYAKHHNVKIAFSSISFETWILLHFGYTTRAFDKSENIISYLKHTYNFDYYKSDYDTFNKIKDKTETAIANAKKVNKFIMEGYPNSKIYELNPYTDVYKLIEELLSFKIHNL